MVIPLLLENFLSHPTTGGTPAGMQFHFLSMTGGIVPAAPGLNPRLISATPAGVGPGTRYRYWVALSLQRSAFNRPSKWLRMILPCESNVGRSKSRCFPLDSDSNPGMKKYHGA